jgi:hypothetical protein
MFWFRKSPFDRQEDPIEHMVALLSNEAANAGIPLSDDDKKLLASEVMPGARISEELRNRTKKLIEGTLKREQASGPDEDPKSFGNSLEWAGDPGYPNIVMLTEEVITSGTSRKSLAPLHGRRWLKDNGQLIGCRLAVVLFLMLIGITIGLISERKWW